VVNLDSNSFVGLDYEPNVSHRSYQTVLTELEQFQPDIIHVDEPERLFVGFWRVAGVDYAKKRNIPCVSFFRTNFLDYLEDYFPLPKPIFLAIKFLLKRLIVWVYNSYDLTLVTSKVTYPKVRDLGINNAQDTSLVGFDSDRFKLYSPQTDFFQSHYGLKQVDDLVKIVFLGRLYPDKGWNFTLEAFKTISQKIDLTKVSLIVVGDGHCDLHVTTSEKETRGLTILEAFAAGIPVVAPNSGGVIENIQDGSNGFLYTPGDVLDFMHKLQQLVENSTLREQMGDRARNSIQAYSWEQAIQNLVNVWQEAISQYGKQDVTVRGEASTLAKARHARIS